MHYVVSGLHDNIQGDEMTSVLEQGLGEMREEGCFCTRSEQLVKKDIEILLKLSCSEVIMRTVRSHPSTKPNLITASTFKIHALNYW